MERSKTRTQSKQQPASNTNHTLRRNWSAQPPDQPILRFSPTAWAKLAYFCHRGDTEIGGFGVSRADDLLAVEDFITICQKVTAVSVAFDVEAVADYFEAQVDAGRQPEQFSRIWMHTHPGNIPEPSGIDESTFCRVFGGCTWAIMFILARGGRTYCRLRFNVGPGGSIAIPVEVDYSQPFTGSDHAAWRAEYERNIHPEPIIARGSALSPWNDLRAFDEPTGGQRDALRAEDHEQSHVDHAERLAAAEYDARFLDDFEPQLAADLFDFDPAECEVY
jgi:proteasome lid subunit RPN8/RPN11